MINVICLTKTYNKNDIEAWLQYHSKFIERIWLLDNESLIGEKAMRELAAKYHANYMSITGFADQWHLFGSILNQRTEIKFKQDDLVCFLDDDEYLYFNCEIDKIEETVRKQFRMLDCILLPEILMSTKQLKKKRSELLPNLCTYKRPDLTSKGKAIIWWNDYSKYSYTVHDEQKGYVPWIDKRRYSDIVSAAVSNDTFGDTPKDIESQPIALIHYHIKSEDDWTMKINRGSAANPSTETRKNGSYDDDIHKNPKYDNYTVQDFTMKNHFNKVINTV